MGAVPTLSLAQSHKIDGTPTLDTGLEGKGGVMLEANGGQVLPLSGPAMVAHRACENTHRATAFGEESNSHHN